MNNLKAIYNNIDFRYNRVNKVNEGFLNGITNVFTLRTVFQVLERNGGRIISKRYARDNRGHYTNVVDSYRVTIGNKEITIFAPSNCTLDYITK